MWLLRSKTAVPEASGEVPPPAVVPVRRIEITVERHSITRLSRSDAAAPEETPEPEFQTGLPQPPDG